MLGGVAVGHRRVQLPEGGCEWIRMRCEAFDKDIDKRPEKYIIDFIKL